jgi:hypothetical protein
VLLVVLLIVVNVTRDNMVPADELLNNPASPNVVLHWLVAKVVSALQDGGLFANPVVVNVPIASRLIELDNSVWPVAGAVVSVPTPI